MPPTFTVGTGILPHWHNVDNPVEGRLFTKQMFMDRSCNRTCGTCVGFTCQMCRIESLQFQTYCSLEPVYSLTRNVLMSSNSLWAILPVLNGKNQSPFMDSDSANWRVSNCYECDLKGQPILLFASPKYHKHKPAGWHARVCVCTHCSIKHEQDTASHQIFHLKLSTYYWVIGA